MVQRRGAKPSPARPTSVFELRKCVSVMNIICIILPTVDVTVARQTVDKQLPTVDVTVARQTVDKQLPTVDVTVAFMPFLTLKWYKTQKEAK